MSSQKKQEYIYTAITARIEDISSGKDVPIATIVTPTRKEGIPKKTPIFSADSVKQPDAFIKTNKLAINTIIQINKTMIVLEP